MNIFCVTRANMCKHTRGKDFLVHSAVLMIVHQKPVLQQEEEHVFCLQVPNHHVLYVPGRVQTYNYMYHSIRGEPGFDPLLYEKQWMEVFWGG